MERIKLNRNNLSRIRGPVKVPVYNQNELISSIIHIGLGHFHRAHQAAYLDELLNSGICKDGIFEINLIPDNFPLAQILEEQDYLYTLLTKNPAAKIEARVAAPIIGYMNAAENREATIIRTADQRTNLITLTVTEGGYYYDKAAKKPNLNEKAIKWDLENPDNPKTAPGFLAAVLARRFRDNKKPLTIMCCDNVPSNGEVLESSVLYFCHEHHREIISWIEDNVSFPSSMVDRITPGTTPALISEIETRYGIIDNWPVCGEDFRQWVLEENFRTPVPDFAAAGVQIVKDVEPYELMKMRLLNGSHMALAYTGYLLGCRLADEAVTHSLLGNFIRNFYMEQATPTLAPVPGIDINEYKNTLISRFSNKNISDTILRLCSLGSGKMPNYVINPLVDAIQMNLPHSAFCFVLACWARYLYGKDEEGREITIDDPNGKSVIDAAKVAQKDPKAFLTAAGIKPFISESQFNTLAGVFKSYLDEIYRKGTRAVLEEFVSG